MPPLGTPLAHSKFTLNTAGVAGFFGGEGAISAMATIHLYEGRRWLGWYNSPGSYKIAETFSKMADSRFWRGLFPGPSCSPAVLFGLDGMHGPRYIAALCGTMKPTGHAAYLTIERSKELEAEVIRGRVTRPVNVTYLAMNPVNHDSDSPTGRLPFKDALLALFPIAVNVVACVMCALVYDWFSFSTILIGIISHGTASFVIGSGQLIFRSVKEAAPGSPPGHGIMMGDNEIVVIKGEQRDIHAVTTGHFDLEMDPEQGNKRLTIHNHYPISICCLLLVIQFLLQLLLVPQGTLFGQIMFVISLGVSWGYDSYLSSLAKEKIQIAMLFQKLREPSMLRFRAGTRTTMTVFVCLLTFHGVKCSSTDEDRERRERILNSCLPNDIPVWRRWKEKVVQQLLSIDDGFDSLCYLEEEEKDQVFSESERSLLRTLLGDARAAFEGYFLARDRLPDDSSHSKGKRQ